MDKIRSLLSNAWNTLFAFWGTTCQHLLTFRKINACCGQRCLRLWPRLWRFVCFGSKHHFSASLSDANRLHDGGGWKWQQTHWCVTTFYWSALSCSCAERTAGQWSTYNAAGIRRKPVKNRYKTFPCFSSTFLCCLKLKCPWFFKWLTFSSRFL